MFLKIDDFTDVSRLFSATSAVAWAEVRAKLGRLWKCKEVCGTTVHMHLHRARQTRGTWPPTTPRATTSPTLSAGGPACRVEPARRSSAARSATAEPSRAEQLHAKPRSANPADSIRAESIGAEPGHGEPSRLPRVQAPRLRCRRLLPAAPPLS